MNQRLLQRAKKIKLMVFDVDGVMTDGGLILGDDGQEYKSFSTLDGLGMKLLQNSGVEIAIITGRTSNVVQNRANSLGIKHLYQGIDNKLSAFRELLDKLNMEPEQVGFMGDDVVDAPAMIRSGLAVTVPAAPENVKAIAHYTTQRAGGKGAVREACEVIMQAQGSFDAQMSPFFDMSA